MGGPIPNTPKSAMQRQLPPGQMMDGVQRMPGHPQQVTKQHMMPNGQQASVNGFAQPHMPPGQQPPPNAAARGALRNNAARSVQGTQGTPTREDFGAHSPALVKGMPMVTPKPAVHEDGRPAMADGAVVSLAPPFANSDEYKPCSRECHTYGGLDLNATSKLGAELIRFRPDVPAAMELGNIDIHALTRSIQSGIRSEVRLALDTLATVTISGLPGLDIELDKCDDLLDTLIEYAEELVELLAESTVEVSDEILIPPYEDVARACQIEKLSIRDEPEMGSDEDELEKVVNNLLCVTTIFRNLSFNPRNQPFLAEEQSVKFLCQVIRYVGTRNMLLRTQLNTLDFMKDLIILLSNISASIEIPDREEAFCLLQFLLAFAPTSAPSLTDEHIFFPSFQPSCQPYLPPAVDALAKLLARDEPNRSHFCNVFTMDASSGTPYDLLTKTFALAISPLPEHVRDARPRPFPPVVEARKPILMQGLLAADIVASLAPTYESGVTRAWLEADNGFAQNLHRAVRDLCRQFDSVEIQARNYRQQLRKDGELMYIVVLAISMLRRLSEKALDPNDAQARLPASVLPSEEGLLEALAMISGEWSRDGFLPNLLAFAALDG